MSQHTRLIALLGLIFVTCSTSKTDQQVSVARIETPIPDTTYHEPPLTFHEDSASLVLQRTFGQMHDRFNERLPALLSMQLQIKSAGYQSNITWYFDSLFTLQGYHEDWFLEDNSGTRRGIFSNGKLVAVKETDYSGDDKTCVIACRGMPARLFSENQNGKSSRPLQGSFVVLKQAEWLQHLRESLSRVGEDAARVVERDDNMELQVSTAYDLEGGAITEVTLYTVEKSLFQHLAILQPQASGGK